MNASGRASVAKAVVAMSGLILGWVTWASGPAQTVGRGEWGQLGDGARIYSPYPVGVTLPQPALAVSPGTTHTLALLADGTVWAWGENDKGQLGDGTTVSRTVPGPVHLLSNIQVLQAGNHCNYAIDASHQLWAWGENGDGRLGDGTTQTRMEPVSVPGITDARQVSGGFSHGAALDGAGTVWTWGSNSYGYLGNGTTTPSLVPIAVPGLGPAKAVAAQQWATYALLEDGSVWAWGYNVYGALGDGTGTNRYSPVQVVGPSNVTAIAAGYMSGLALTSEGTVWGWGMWLTGSTAAPINGLPHVTAVVAGDRCFFALETDGTVWAWTNNSLGQLADGTTHTRSSPARAATLGQVTSLAVFYDAVGAVKADGSLWMWGGNDAGQLGDGRVFDRMTFGPVDGSRPFTSVSGGSAHSVALAEDGTVWGWGKNPAGQLGTGSDLTPSSEPVRVGTLADVVSATAGENHCTAVRSDGTVWWWGGYLSAYAYVPSQKTTLSDAVEAASGSNFSLVRKSDRTLWGWGNNGSGRLGDGTTTSTTTPVQVQGVATATGVAAGVEHGLAVLAGGSVVAWGGNAYGQLGDGTTTDRLTPTPVLGLPGPVQTVIAGGNASFALLQDGSLWAWGRNDKGQLGDGTTTQRNAPVGVTGMGSGVSSVACSGNHTLALKSDGSVWAWGDNSVGQLGDGTTTNRLAPVQVAPPGTASSVAAGSGFSAFIEGGCGVGCSATVPAAGAPGLNLAFQGGVDPGGCAGVAAYDWDFGDGSAHSSDQSPFHAYATSGNFGWTLGVSQGGRTCTRRGQVAVAPCLLTCTATVPSQGTAQAPVSFSASAAPGLYCGSDSPSYDWDYGDGSAHGSGPGPSRTYAVAGNYDWSVTASTAGANCTRAGSITIALCPIVCSATVPATGTATQPVVFAASVTESCGGGVTYEWDFGDGSAHSSAQSPSHTYASGGSYTWALTVSGSGVSCTHGGSIAVSAPTPPPSVSSMFKQGSPFRINVNGSNLQSGIRVFINGSEWTNLQYKSVTLIKLKGGGSLKALVPKNTPTTFRFDNPDGGSQTLVWQWP